MIRAGGQSQCNKGDLLRHWADIQDNSGDNHVARQTDRAALIDTKRVGSAGTPSLSGVHSELHWWVNL